MRKKATTKWKQNLIKLLDKTDTVIYTIIAIFLIAMAFASFIVVGKDVLNSFSSGSTISVILIALKDLMVAIIVVELLQTVVVFIREEQVDIRMILGAGLTAMVRKVLVFGVEEVEILEMAVVVALIIVLTLAIVILTRYACTKVGASSLTTLQ
jgi:uncharacterized membrane protein (DUF373 family)